MNQTTIYLSEDTSRLEALSLDVYFPETKLHPKEIIKKVPELIGKTFCTHSEVILNYLGYMISIGLVSHLDIKVIILYPDEILTMEYDSEGYLVNWNFFLEWNCYLRDVC